MNVNKSVQQQITALCARTLKQAPEHSDDARYAKYITQCDQAFNAAAKRDLNEVEGLRT